MRSALKGKRAGQVKLPWGAKGRARACQREEERWRGAAVRAWRAPGVLHERHAQALRLAHHRSQRRLHEPMLREELGVGSGEHRRRDGPGPDLRQSSDSDQPTGVQDRCQARVLRHPYERGPSQRRALLATSRHSYDAQLSGRRRCRAQDAEGLLYVWRGVSSSVGVIVDSVPCGCAMGLHYYYY